MSKVSPKLLFRAPSTISTKEFKMNAIEKFYSDCGGIEIFVTKQRTKIKNIVKYLSKILFESFMLSIFCLLFCYIFLVTNNCIYLTNINTQQALIHLVLQESFVYTWIIWNHYLLFGKHKIIHILISIIFGIMVNFVLRLMMYFQFIMFSNLFSYFIFFVILIQSIYRSTNFVSTLSILFCMFLPLSLIIVFRDYGISLYTVLSEQNRLWFIYGCVGIFSVVKIIVNQ